MTHRARPRRGALAHLAPTVLVSVGLLLAGCGRAAPDRSAAQGSSRIPRTTPAAFVANSDLSFSVPTGRPGTTLMVMPTCGASRSLDLDFQQTRAGASLGEDFTGPLVACDFRPGLARGQLTARWGERLSLAVDLELAGTPRVFTDRVATGCVATDTVRTYRMSGSLHIRIHAAVLGLIQRPPRRLVASTTLIPSCAEMTPGEGAGEEQVVFDTLFPGPRRAAHPHRFKPHADGDDLTGYRGNTQLDAQQDSEFPFGVNLRTNVTDPVAPGVHASVDLGLPARDFQTRNGTLSSARIDAASPFSSGAMTYDAHQVCRDSAGATQGAMSGYVRIADPGVLALTLTGADIGPTELNGPRPGSEGCPVLGG